MINEKSLHFLRVAASKAIVIISKLAVVAICMIYASPDLQVDHRYRYRHHYD
jgi:hypothetical protein